MTVGLRRAGPSEADELTTRAVFLDVGWTLIYPRLSIWELLAEVCAECGGSLEAAAVERLIHGVMTADRSAAVARLATGTEYDDSNKAFSAQFMAMCRLVCATAGTAGDPEELCRRFLARFWTAENWAVFPDVLDGIERLRGRGLRVGALSNAHSGLVEFLDQLGLLSRLDFAVVSAIEGTKKPDRRIFECALRRAGVPAEAAVHVGDMYLEDVLGARNVGVRAILIDRGPRRMFPNHPETVDGGADGCEVVDDLHGVLAAIA